MEPNIKDDHDVRLVRIETTQERILDHHIEFKNNFTKMFEKFEHIQKSISDEVLARQAAIAEADQNCKDIERDIYKKVGIGALSIIVVMVGSFFLWVKDNLQTLAEKIHS